MMLEDVFDDWPEPDFDATESEARPDPESMKPPSSCWDLSKGTLAGSRPYSILFSHQEPILEAKSYRN
jgi:hypothetical protein